MIEEVVWFQGSDSVIVDGREFPECALVLRVADTLEMALLHRGGGGYPIPTHPDA